MKTLLIIFFSGLAGITFGQDVVVSAGVEKTVIGNQYDVALVFETRKSWGLGAFFQTGINGDGGEEGYLKNQFYGISLQAPVARSQRISFVVALRTGLVNQKFLIVAPSFETRILITKKAGFTVGAGLRSGYPSLSAKLFVRLF